MELLLSPATPNALQTRRGREDILHFCATMGEENQNSLGHVQNLDAVFMNRS